EELALHEQDDVPQGFQWLIGDDATNSVFAWLRWSKAGKPVLVVANFTPVPREAYRVGVPEAGTWHEIINSDAGVYSGSNYGNGGGVSTDPQPSHGQEVSLALNPPPLGVLILRAE
ncbi:1,4-alpha-glucan branching enzyme, partial [Pseudomonas sp. FSL R10-0071]|uniref:alpha amylase C-terminal domain-containing protein n=1 Tax=Pseudomonas sp. FSL R10-0071 TaxID=2662193 RepID=UPI00135F54E1